MTLEETTVEYTSVKQTHDVGVSVGDVVSGDISSSSVQGHTSKRGDS